MPIHHREARAVSSRLSYVIAVMLLLSVVFLRLWDVTKLPYGYSADEIINIRITETIRQGRIAVFYDVNGISHEGLFQTVLTLTTLATGDGTLGYRMMSAWAGIIALALIYTLGVRLYGTWAGLGALGLLGVMFLPVLMSRLVLANALIPLIVTASLLAMARALPVYRHTRDDDGNTLAFAMMAFILGISPYIHAVGLVLILVAMAFITFIVLTIRPLSYVRLSLIGFSILIMLILGIPYLLSSINHGVSVGDVQRALSMEGVITSAIANLGALFWEGDANPLYNVPLRPLLDPITTGVIFFGLGVALRRWRTPSHSLTLLTLLIFLPGAVFASNAPNNLALMLLTVPMALAFGLGLQTLQRLVKAQYQWFFVASAILLFLFNWAWTAGDLFNTWRFDPQRQVAYNDDLGQIARHIDQTAHRIPTVLCYGDWDNRTERPHLYSAELVLIMMNRARADLRFIDCDRSLLFVDGGAYQQWILTDATQFANMHPYLRDWVLQGEFLRAGHLPRQRIVRLDARDALADEAGTFTTLSPSRYAIEANAGEDRLVPPPVRFGGNITWLGYLPPQQRIYQPGDVLPIINYWRVEGLVPSDLIIFHHLLSDPVTVVENRDEILVNPRQLRDRDVFIQLTQIPLSTTLTQGDYVLSIGTYQQTSAERLDVFEGTETRGNRLLLYHITIEPPPDDATDE